MISCRSTIYRNAHIAGSCRQDYTQQPQKQIFCWHSEHGRLHLWFRICLGVFSVPITLCTEALKLFSFFFFLFLVGLLFLLFDTLALQPYCWLLPLFVFLIIDGKSSSSVTENITTRFGGVLSLLFSILWRFHNLSCGFFGVIS
jgi:hypothetical protein